MSPTDLIDLPSLAIVVGGLSAATILRTPAADVRQAFSAAVRRPLSQAVSAQVARLEQAVALRGRFAVDPAIGADDDLDAAARLLVRGDTSEAIRGFLDEQRSRRSEAAAMHRAVFAEAAEAAPVMGLIGTVLGLMSLFADGGSGALSGGGLATALTTTLYGAVLGTLILSPLAARIGSRVHREEAVRRQIEARLLALADRSGRDGIGPRLVHAS